MLDEAMLRFVCAFCLLACSKGFVVDDEDVGPDGAVDSWVIDAVDDVRSGDVSAPDDVGSLDAALSDASPVNNDEVIVACAAVGAQRGAVASLRIMDGAGITRSLLVVNSVIGDAEIYAP